MTDDTALRRTVMLLTLAAFASAVSMRMCDPLLPVLAAEFHTDLATAAHVITGFALAYGALQLVIGPAADRLGKYRVATAATGVAAGAALACALAPGLDSLVAARVLAGGVGGAIIPVALAWVGDSLPMAQRQPVLAQVMSGSLLGLIAGQLVSGVLADTLGWRWAFVVLAVLMGAVATALWRGGAAVRQLGGQAADPAAPGPRGLGGWLRAYAALARPPWPRRVLAITLSEGLIFYGALSFMPSALHQRFDLPLWQAAGVSALVGAGGLAYTLLARPIVGRLGQRSLACLGGALVALGLLAIAWGPWLPLAVAGAVALGLGFYAFHNTLQVHGTQLSTTQRGMGMALFALSLFLGQSLGVALAAWALPWLGFDALFVVAGLGFAALTLALVRGLGRYAG